MMKVSLKLQLFLAVLALAACAENYMGFIPSSSLQFQYPTFANLSGITLVTEAPWYYARPGGVDDPAVIDSAIYLTPLVTASESNLGRMVYKDPIALVHHSLGTHATNTSASFNTSFIFQIICTVGYPECGSGMAFFISPSLQAPVNSTGRGLGLDTDNSTAGTRPPPYPFFALEFDTYKSKIFNDLDASHVGLDLDSLISARSVATTNVSSHPELYLYNNYTFTAWIEYYASTSLIQVWMTNATSRPSQPLIQFQFDLATIFQDDQPLYVGFTATNPQPLEEGIQANIIYSWNFSSTDLPVATANGSTVAPESSHLPGSQNDIQNSPSSSKPKIVVLVLAPIASAGALVGICCGSIWWWKWCRQAQPDDCDLYPTSLTRYTFSQLRRATRGFHENNKIGEGAFSNLFKGILADNSIVAVKRLKEGFRKEEEFSTEIQIISKIRHRNLLELQGWCYEKKEALLVYKYMSHGSLDTFLFGSKRGSLDSETRLKILEGVGIALEYLHEGLSECVLHRDVKAANVLINEDFEAVLSDFGLARLVTHDRGAVTMTLAGTPGYVAPEVIYTGKATPKADVYSFGMLAIETACGRSCLDNTMLPEQIRLLDWVWLLYQSDRLLEVLDPNLVASIKKIHDDVTMRKNVEEQWRCVLHVALMCCHPTPEYRPTMRQAIQAMQDCILIPLPASRPIYPRSPDFPSKSQSNATSTYEFISHGSNSQSG